MTYHISPQMIALLKQELARCDNNTAALARKIGINPSYIFKYINGTVKSVQADTWLKLCRYFPELDDRPMIFRGNTAPVRATGQHIPEISSRVAAEACRYYYLPIAEYAIDNPEHMVSFSLGKAGDFAIQVLGNSMSPWYPEGTILLVRPNVRLDSGDPVVAILGNGEVVFKFFVEGKTKITLASVNGDDGQTYQFAKADSDAVKALYKVIQSMRDESAIKKAMKSKGMHRSWEKFVHE